MSEMKWAIITGVNGGIGTETTRAVAKAGYRIIVACYHPKKAGVVCRRLNEETGNSDLEAIAIDLPSMQFVVAFASQILGRDLLISLLTNNVGTIETGSHTTSRGFERTVSVSRMRSYLLTRKLVPLIVRGAHVINMASCAYTISKLDLPDFFHREKTRTFWRIPVYSNTELALLLLTLELSEQLREKGISANVAGPGIVSTDIIAIHKWFDSLTDVFFRSFIRKPKKGASTAIDLLLDGEEAGMTG